MIVDFKNVLKDIDRRYGITYRRLKRRSRRSMIFVFLIGFILFYLFVKSISHRTIEKNIHYDECLQNRLELFTAEQSEMNVIVNHEPIRYGEIVSLPFTGNGFLGLSHDFQSQVQLLLDIRSSFISTGFSPIVRMTSDTPESSSATTLHMKTGVTRRIQCFKFSESRSVFVTHLLYAHRKRGSLIVQEIDIVNPSETTFDLNIEEKSQIVKHDLKTLRQEILQFDTIDEQFQLTINQISPRQHHSILIVIIQKKIQSNIRIGAGSQEKFSILTVMKFSPLLSEDSLTNKTYFDQWKDKLEQQAKDDLSDALKISSTRLFNEHVETWTSIWQSGFTISRSLAPSAMNGDVVNRTIYYVLCATPAPLYDMKIDEKQRNEFNQSLFQIDQCYESHSTLIGEKLWISPGDDLAVSQLANLWRSTLSRKGCFTLMRSGADGILQAILLSIGGIRFRDHHLEMFLDPKDLHRDLLFRSINFGKRSRVNISITVDHDNRAVIDVSIDNQLGQAYACDAGCLDQPTKLGIQPVRFPVKMTSPPTAILYITEDFEYMSQLKETLHVKEVEIAPPQAHDVLALHRHGHKFGGLPLIFWIALAFLIIIFHLFLIKIILNEMGFFKSSLPIYTRARVL